MTSWRHTDARRCAALRRFHDSFAWRSIAVARDVDELIAHWRSHPSAPNGSRLNDNEDYVDRKGDVMRDGMLSPGT